MFITTYTDHCSFHAVGRRHGPNPGGLFTKVSGSLRLAMKIVDGQPRPAQRYAHPASTGRSLDDLLKGGRGQRGHQRTGRVGIRLFVPQHALRGRNRFFQTYPVAGHRLSRSLALAMVRTDYPRKLTESIAELLQKILTSQ